jgi:Putative cyclase
MTARKITRQDLRDAAEKYKNWGKWGPNDEIGTLNYTHPEDIVAAARLVRKGKVISLALNFDHTGPQGAKSNYPSMGRTNPIHTMIRTGTDAYSGVLDKRGIRAADDMVTMPLQCGTQWDGLGHVFYEDRMWNGYDCREVTSAGAQKCGIEKTKNKMVGRGVFLDVARALGKEALRADAGGEPQARRLRRRSHRPDGALPQGRQLGRLSRRRRAGLCLRDARVGGAHGARGARQRHLGLRGAAEQHRRRHQPALALDHHPDHGHDHGRDLLSQGPGRGLRGRQGL